MFRPPSKKKIMNPRKNEIIAIPDSIAISNNSIFFSLIKNNKK